mgnify:CR=1 FL=1
MLLPTSIEQKCLEIILYQRAGWFKTKFMTYHGSQLSSQKLRATRSDEKIHKRCEVELRQPLLICCWFPFRSATNFVTLSSDRRPKEINITRICVISQLLAVTLWQYLVFKNIDLWGIKTVLIAILLLSFTSLIKTIQDRKFIRYLQI